MRWHFDIVFDILRFDVWHSFGLSEK